MPVATDFYEFTHVYVVYDGPDGPFLSSDFGSALIQFNPAADGFDYVATSARLTRQDGQDGAAGDVTDLNLTILAETYRFDGYVEEISILSVSGYGFGPIAGVTGNGEALFEAVRIEEVEQTALIVEYDPGTGEAAVISHDVTHETIGADFTVFLTDQAYAEGAALPEMTEGAVLVCFGEGTLIATPAGEVPVERLARGDLVLTADGRSVPVKWLGRQTVDHRFGPAERLAPIRIAAGAFGAGVPHSDLTVTADHGMVLDGMIVHAAALVNGTTICRVPLSQLGRRRVVYHIETEGHQVVLANGAASETFIDTVTRSGFDNFAEYGALYGDAPEIAPMPLPRALGPRQVPAAVKRRLAARAEALGLTVAA